VRRLSPFSQGQKLFIPTVKKRPSLARSELLHLESIKWIKFHQWSSSSRFASLSFFPPTVGNFYSFQLPFKVVRGRSVCQMRRDEREANRKFTLKFTPNNTKERARLKEDTFECGSRIEYIQRKSKLPSRLEIMYRYLATETINDIPQCKDGTNVLCERVWTYDTSFYIQAIERYWTFQFQDIDAFKHSNLLPYQTWKITMRITRDNVCRYSPRCLHAGCN